MCETTNKYKHPLLCFQSQTGLPPNGHHILLKCTYFSLSLLQFILMYLKSLAKNDNICKIYPKMATFYGRDI